MGASTFPAMVLSHSRLEVLVEVPQGPAVAGLRVSHGLAPVIQLQCVSSVCSEKHRGSQCLAGTALEGVETLGLKSKLK